MRPRSMALRVAAALAVASTLAGCCSDRLGCFGLPVLRGIVVDLDSGQPVRGATVTDHEATFRSDGHGCLAVAGEYGRPFVFTVVRRGYKPLEVTAAPGERVFRITLARLATPPAGTVAWLDVEPTSPVVAPACY